MITEGKLNITLDGQFGSTGKGVLNSYIAKQWGDKLDICVSNAAPNAGHTYVDDYGQKRTTFHLPVSGVMLPHTDIYLCAGSIIDPELLEKEMKEFDIDPARVYIHPRACILLPEHKQREQQGDSGATSIASTQKGVGAALADKVARVRGTRVAEQYFAADSKGMKIAPLDLALEMEGGATVLMEVPQGYSLSLNHGFQYPQCTSRDLTVAQALNDAGVHPHWLGHVTVSLRTLPIRVGNIVSDGVEIGNSGGFYPDSVEKTWEELGFEPELTTVTKRVRRIATFSFEQYHDMLVQLRPDSVFLNFCNYLSQREACELLDAMGQVEADVGVRPEAYVGHGPRAGDVAMVYPGRN